MILSIILSILSGQYRHALSLVGGMVLAHGLKFVNGVPQVQHLESAITGGLLAGTALIFSAAHKVKTKSGADYKGLNS